VDATTRRILCCMAGGPRTVTEIAGEIEMGPHAVADVIMPAFVTGFVMTAGLSGLAARFALTAAGRDLLEQPDRAPAETSGAPE
jgi:hypothetical protein